MTKHKWHDEIVAWAGGAEIEVKIYETNDWRTVAKPEWVLDYYYRIKPQPKQPNLLFVIQNMADKSIRLSADGFYIAKLEDMIGKIEVQDD